MIRESVSRPSESVPSRWLARRLREHCGEVGRVLRVRRDPRREDGRQDEGDGDEQAGDGERPPQEAAHEQPPPARPRRQRREPARARAPLDEAHSAAPADADARIEDRVDEVDGEVDDDVAGGGDEDDALDQRVVPLVDRVDRQPPEAGDDEDLLGDDGPRDQRAELQADHRRDRDQAVADGVDADDAPLRQPLRPRRPDVVGRERVEHRGAHLPHQHGRQRRAEHERGQEHVPQVLDGIVPQSHVPARREPAELDGEEDDQEQAQPEMRHRQPDERGGRRRVVGGLAAPHRGDHPRSDAEQRPEQHREAGELQRDRQPGHDRVRDRELPLVEPEVALERKPGPAPVLHRQRLVEPVLVADLLEDGGIAVLRRERQRRVAGEGADPGEHQHAGEEDHDQGGSRLSQQEAAHDRSSGLLPPT